MGQAKQKFAKEPWRVIYLAENSCDLQAIDQRAYIAFDRSDMRTVVEAMRRLVQALRSARLLATEPVGAATPSPAPEQIDPLEILRSLEENQRKILAKVGGSTGGGVWFSDLQKLSVVICRDVTAANLAVRALYARGLLANGKPPAPGQMTMVFPSALGWELVRVMHARAQQQVSAQAFAEHLARAAAIRAAADKGKR